MPKEISRLMISCAACGSSSPHEHQNGDATALFQPFFSYLIGSQKKFLDFKQKNQHRQEIYSPC
jgi:hypothetical protein